MTRLCTQCSQPNPAVGKFCSTACADRFDRKNLRQTMKLKPGVSADHVRTRLDYDGARPSDKLERKEPEIDWSTQPRTKWLKCATCKRSASTMYVLPDVENPKRIVPTCQQHPKRGGYAITRRDVGNNQKLSETLDRLTERGFREAAVLVLEMLARFDCLVNDPTAKNTYAAGGIASKQADENGEFVRLMTAPTYRVEPFDHYLRKQLRRLLADELVIPAVQSLTRQQKRAFELSQQYDDNGKQMVQEQIATRMGVDQSVVSRHLANAKKGLAESLELLTDDGLFVFAVDVLFSPDTLVEIAGYLDVSLKTIEAALAYGQYLADFQQAVRTA
jgi:hypothetical protein